MLAHALGFAHPDHMSKALTTRQITEWILFWDEQGGFPIDREDFYQSNIAYLTYVSQFAFGGKPTIPFKHFQAQYRDDAKPELMPTGETRDEMIQRIEESPENQAARQRLMANIARRKSENNPRVSV